MTIHKYVVVRFIPFLIKTKQVVGLRQSQRLSSIDDLEIYKNESEKGMTEIYRDPSERNPWSVHDLMVYKWLLLTYFNSLGWNCFSLKQLLLFFQVFWISDSILNFLSLDMIFCFFCLFSWSILNRFRKPIHSHRICRH